MKKSLVLAMAMALGVTASAYAANPFSDVPAGHWAYDSISKLAAAGVIEGYGDDTFRGDRLMTRYEMAQIVAKAMAKGANVDKLAAEFADELDALGVRVAALEKKSDNVRITGQFRYHYESYKNDGVKGHSNKLRTRLTFTGKVNDNWNYVGLIENQQDLTDNTGNEGTNFQRAFLEGRLGGVKVTAGRINQNLVEGEVYGTRMDGIDIKYGKKIRLGAYYGKPTNMGATATYKTREKDDAGKWKSWVTEDEMKYDRMWGVNAAADLGKNVVFSVGYDEFKDFEDSLGNAVKSAEFNRVEKAKVFNAGLKYNAKDFTLGATYLHSNGGVLRTVADFKEGSKSGGFVFATYKGAKADKVGSWGLGVRYYHMPAGLVSNGWDASTPLGKQTYTNPVTEAEQYTIGQSLLWEGYKGIYAKANVTVAKNMIAGIQYWDLKGRESNVKNKTLWTDLVVTF